MTSEGRERVVSKSVVALKGIAATALSPSRASRPRSIRRLQQVALVLIAASLASWGLGNLVQGSLRSEFRDAGQWVPPSLAIVASFAIYFITRWSVLSSAQIIRAGLVYEVVISYAITFGSSYQAYRGVAADQLTPDRVGLAWVIPWTLFFTVLVQAPIREAMIALIASATAPAVAFVVELVYARAPSVPVGMFFALFVLPYLVGMMMTWAAARIVHELGLDAKRARELGSYRLESRLGQGGMGEVWRATHHTLARPAAIKIIRAEALDSEPELARLAVVRFEREAQAIASLQSRHTVRLYDFGVTQDGTLYYVMELLDGMDLEEIIQRHGPVSAARAVHILVQACASLAEAHRRGVIHRDVKPANIYLCREAFECDVVKILDFGLAKRVVPTSTGTTTRETRSDLITGTPAYLAPEAISGERALDGRSDVYALGCVAYWLLAGRLVFDAESAMGMLAAHLERAPARPGELAPYPVPSRLDELVVQCLSKSPGDRPQSAEELASMLRKVPLDAPWTPQDAELWWESYPSPERVPDPVPGAAERRAYPDPSPQR